MKIVEINGTNYAGTGNILLNIASRARIEGFDVFTCCKNSRKSKNYKYENQIYIGSRYERLLSEQLAYITGYSDSFNLIGTWLFINKLKHIKPDLIHIHVLHDTYVNQKMLLNYIIKNNIPVVYTFHDCWPFTGRCPHFELIGCDKWKDQCDKCPQLDRYPKTLFDRSKYLYNRKKQLLTSINNLNIVTPSNWLYKNVKQSHFKDHNIQVIHNGIDLNKYKPIESNIKETLNIQNKKMVLGVANTWNDKKGLDVFIKLSNMLDDKYQIVLVGVDGEVKKILPSNIIAIDRTHNINELVQLYTAADVFVNPTREEVFGLVNVEALACGTPVVSFETGGCTEIINEKSGIIIEKNNVEYMKQVIEEVCINNHFSKQDCIDRAKQFDVNKMSEEYVSLYKKVLNKK